MNRNVHDLAVSFLAIGFAVLPLHRPIERGGRRVCSCGKADCPSPAKHPVGKLAPRGVLDATRDRATIDGWFAGTGWNIGIATGAASGIVALDIDPRHGGDESLRILENVHGALLPTWRFLTGGGGEHILFRHPGGVVKNSSGALGAGIDARGDGGYIVAPPSEHMSGRAYAISVDHHPEEVELADLPHWLTVRMREPVAASKGKLRIGSDPVDWRAHLGGSFGEGERNMALARTAGLLLGRGLDPDAATEVKDLFASWVEWSTAAGEFTGSIKRFSTALAARGLQRGHHPMTRRAVIHGVRLIIRASPFGGGYGHDR